MNQLRYVARLQTTTLEKALVAVLMLGPLFLAAGLRLAWSWGYWAWVSTVDLYAFRLSADMGTTVIWILGLAWLLSFIPRKLLVFENGLALKCLWVRAIWVPLTDLDSIGPSNLHRARKQGSLVPMTTRTGTLICRKNGRNWLIRTRDSAELEGLLKTLGFPVTG